MLRLDPMAIVLSERSRILRWARAVAVLGLLFLTGCAGLSRSRVDQPGEAVRPRVISRQEWESERLYIRYGYPSLRGRLLYRQSYIVSADPQTKNPIWIAFRLDPVVVGSSTTPLSPYRADPELLKGERAEPIDYEARPQVPGRLLPERDSQTAGRITDMSLLSARAPMDPSVDSSLWPALLDRCRAYGQGQRPVQVIAGPVYLGEPTWIGPSRVQVPSHFFAIAYWGSAADGDLVVAALMVPNAPYSPVHLDRFAVSVDHIENLTDLDFFPELHDDAEAAVEGQWPA